MNSTRHIQFIVLEYVSQISGVPFESQQKGQNVSPEGSIFGTVGKLMEVARFYPEEDQVVTVVGDMFRQFIFL